MPAFGGRMSRADASGGLLTGRQDGGLGLSAEAKRMVLALCALLPVISAGGLAWFRSFEALPFAAGVLIMTGVNVLKVLMIERTVRNTVSAGIADGRPAESRRNYVLIQYLLRYLITGLAIAAALKTEWVSVWGILAGILAFPVAAYSLRFMRAKEKEGI